MKGVFCQREHHRFLRISPTHSSVFFLIFCVLAKKCQAVFLVGFFGKNEDLRKCPNGIDDQEPFCNLLIVAESTSTRDPVQLDDCYRGPTDIYLRLNPPRRVLGLVLGQRSRPQRSVKKIQVFVAHRRTDQFLGE